MSKCLVTTTDVVTDSDLRKTDEMVFHVDSQRVQNMAGNMTFRIIGNGYFTNAAGTANLGKTFTPGTGDDFYISPGRYDILGSSKYNTTWFRANSSEFIHFDLSNFKYSANLDSLELSFCGHKGSINDLPNTMTYIGVSKMWYSKGVEPVTGDIGMLTNPSITRFTAPNTNIGGNLSAFGNKTGLTVLDLVNTNVTGNLSSIGNLTSLTILGVGGTAITGSLTSLANMTQLEILDVSSTNISGDTASLSGVTNLTVFRYSNCPNITGSWPLN